jgi:hypothetical protein
MAWDSHDLLAELLQRAAGSNLARRQSAGLLLVSRDWCWSDFLALEHPEKEWAIKTLAGHLLPDEIMPYLRPTPTEKGE